MNDIEEKQLTPEQTLMNCLGGIDRVKEIIIIMYNKDNSYESWSNNLPCHVRLGILRIASLRCEHGLDLDLEVE